MVKKFNKKLDSPLVEDKSINSFLEDDRFFTDEEEKDSLEKLIKTFIAVFNELKREVFEYGVIGN